MNDLTVSRRSIVVVLVTASTLLLAACGGTASTSGGATGATSSAKTSTAGSGGDGMAGMDMGPSAAPAVASLRLAKGSFTAAQAAAPLTFSIADVHDRTITAFQEEQTKLLHLIVVRDDLTGYQHLHPEVDAKGTWTVPVTFAHGGTYRVVADFVPVIDGKAYGRTVVTGKLTVEGDNTPVPLPAPAASTTVDGYTVALQGSLNAASESVVTFTITDAAGKPVALDTYLGAYGHLVAFSAKDLAYVHIHPQEAEAIAGTILFEGQVAAPGPHRLFLQFSAGGAVHTAEFTLVAT